MTERELKEKDIKVLFRDIISKVNTIGQFCQPHSNVTKEDRTTYLVHEYLMLILDGYRMGKLTSVEALEAFLKFGDIFKKSKMVF